MLLEIVCTHFTAPVVFFQLNLGGDPSGTLESGATYDGDWSFDITLGELTVGYPVYSHPQGKVWVRRIQRLVCHSNCAKMDTYEVVVIEP